MRAAVLAPANGLVVIDVLAAANALEDFRFLVVAALGNERQNRLADHLLGSIAEHALRPTVPAGDNAVEVSC